MHKSSQSHEYFHISFFCKLQPSLPYHLAQKDPKGCLLLWHFHWSSQATCQCSPACRRLTIGVSVVVKLLAFSLGLQRQNHNFFVQRNCPHTTTLEARHQNYDMIGYSKAPFRVYMNPTLAKTKWWKNQPKRSSLRTLDVVMELFQSNLWVRTSPLNFDSFSSLHFFNAVHRNLRAETHPPGRCSIYKQNFLEELLPPSHWWVALI